MCGGRRTFSTPTSMHSCFDSRSSWRPFGHPSLRWCGRERARGGGRDQPSVDTAGSDRPRPREVRDTDPHREDLRDEPGRHPTAGCATLDALGRQQVTVYEPWVRETLTFEGLWLADLLQVAQAAAAARSLHLSALDGYQIDLAMADIGTGTFFVATHTGDGGPISVAAGGPVRVLIVDGTSSKATDAQ